MTDWVKVECPLCGEMAVAETHPNLKREWVGLTDEDLQKVLGFGEFTTESTKATITHLARAVEAKLKEKNGFAEEKNT